MQTVNKLSGVIFDLDGVICSTDKYHYKAWKKLADELGIYFDHDINNRLRGISRTDSLAIILENTSKKYTEKQKLEFANIKNEYYKELLINMSERDLEPDVLYTLNSLRYQGYLLAIASSSKNAKLILSKIGLANFFDAVSDGNNIEYSKPNPEVFIKASQMISKKPHECLVVEDALAGIEAAYRGGFVSAGINDAKNHPNVDYKIDSVADLLDIL